MSSLLNLNSRRSVSYGTEDRPTTQHSSASSSSNSGSSDGFDRSSSTADGNSSWSRDSSPAFEIVLDPDLSYRKEAARQYQEANAAITADQLPNGDAASLPPGAPLSSDVSSYEDSNMEDALWDELMGVSDSETNGAQSGKDATALDSVNTGPDEAEEDDGLLAPMTDALDQELEEMQEAPQQLAAEKEAAESMRQKASLEEQMRIAAEKSALGRRVDHLREPPRKNNSKAAAIQRVFHRPSLNNRLSSRLDAGVRFSNSPASIARRAQKEAMRTEAQRENQAAVSSPVTTPSEATTSETLAVGNPAGPMITETPANNSGVCTVSAAVTSVQSTQELSRVYHRAESIDWRALWGRMTLTMNFDTQTCLQCLGLDPVRGQEISDKLKEYLRAPGNSVDVSRQEIYSDRGKHIISKLAHSLLCDQLWGQTYFSQPHLECGYFNVRFETDSTWIFIEFSKLLYKTVKVEERRKRAQLRFQQKRDAKNAAKHPVASEFVTAPASHDNAPTGDLQRAVPQPVSALQQVPVCHPTARIPIPVPVGYAPTCGQMQEAIILPLPVSVGRAPPRGLYHGHTPTSGQPQAEAVHQQSAPVPISPTAPRGLYSHAPDPVLVYGPPNTHVPSQVTVPNRAARAFVPHPATAHAVNSPHYGAQQATVHQHGSSPLKPAAPACHAPPRSLQQAAVPRPVSSLGPAASIVPRAPAPYISPHEIRQSAGIKKTPAPVRKTVVDFAEYMAMYVGKR